MRWKRMFLDELEAAFAECPVVYFLQGLCEPHGQHCAVGLDALKAHAVAKRAAREYGGIAARLLAHPRGLRLRRLGCGEHRRDPAVLADVSAPLAALQERLLPPPRRRRAGVPRRDLPDRALWAQLGGPEDAAGAGATARRRPALRTARLRGRRAGVRRAGR
ncbi:MAG: creatininase family protein [Armatimonadetes bacterium]|nr:creatininase family protein [Armatimonadota bacterium]